MNKFISIGECLVDLVPIGNDGKYLAKAGGAPANVCACVSKLGGKGYYLGKLSTDGFSNMLYEKMQSSSVLMDYVLRDSRYKTALAVVTLSKEGDRSFSFYRDNTADLMLNEDEIKQEFFAKGDVLHFCSVALVESPSKYAHIKAIELSKSAGALISFDVNLRLNLYPDLESCKKTVLEFLPYADIIKATDDETVFLTDEIDERKGAAKLLKYAKNAKVLFMTKGPNGASVYDRQGGEIFEAAADVKVVDTTGAGDCFIGSMLYQIMNEGIFETAAQYKDYLHFASIACGEVCGKMGAMDAMPTYSEVKARL